LKILTVATLKRLELRHRAKLLGNRSLLRYETRCAASLSQIIVISGSVQRADNFSPASATCQEIWRRRRRRGAQSYLYPEKFADARLYMTKKGK